MIHAEAVVVDAIDVLCFLASAVFFRIWMFNTAIVVEWTVFEVHTANAVVYGVLGVVRYGVPLVVTNGRLRRGVRCRWVVTWWVVGDVREPVRFVITWFTVT